LAGAPTFAVEAAQAALPAALAGKPGPGYNMEPRQVLIFGHGDAWQRMRVFTLLARQQRIDVVTLAFPGRTISPRPRPWVSAALVKGELYLFDARLGLPIPGKNLEGIATLKEVRADPKLLASLAIDENHVYRVEPMDLAEVSALIDVTAPALSMRFGKLESQLTGEHRTVLAVPLSSLAQRLKASSGVYDAYVWSVPFEAVWYRMAYDERVRTDERAAAQHMMKYGIFEDYSPLVRARFLYFRGQIESDEDTPGAKALLMESRVTQDDLQSLETDERVQQMLGLRRTGRESPEMWQAQLAAARQIFVNTKQCASYWMGLFQLESGRNESAIEWFKLRSLGVWPDGIWSAGARYNMSRAHEAQNEWSKAQEILVADVSPQSHGNYLRARLLAAEANPAQKTSENNTSSPR
jgi:hypothetical protein